MQKNFFEHDRLMPGGGEIHARKLAGFRARRTPRERRRCQVKLRIFLQYLFLQYRLQCDLILVRRMFVHPY